MCGLVGFVNLKHDISDQKDILTNMTKALAKRGPNEESFYINEHINLGHRRLIVSNEHMPVCVTYDENTYTIVYDGRLYNSNEIQEELIDNGYRLNGTSDAKVILTAFIVWR